MGKWRGSLAVHIILPLLLAVAIGFSTVAGMIIEGTKEYANEGGQKQEDFYVSQKQVEQMMDGYLRLYEQYMQIGSVIAPDGMIDYDTVLLTSLSSGEHKQYTLKELLRRANSTGLHASRLRSFMSDFQDKCASGVSYPIEIQYALSARDKVIVDDGQVYQFTNHSGVGVREKQIADALKYESNMVLVNSLTKDYGKQYQKDLDIEIGHLNTMPIQFHASSVYEKYIITYYEKYAKWYFINKLLRYAKDDQGKWSKEYLDFYEQYEAYTETEEKRYSKKECQKLLEQEMEDTYAHIPDNKMPWSMHRIPRTMETATDYAVFLVETYQELHYIFSETNFAYGYQDSAGMLLTNNENWWNQVERMVTAGKVDKATDKSNVLFAYYNNRDYNGQSNLPEDTFEMSGNIQEKIMQIAQEYQGRSYSIAVGLDLNAVRNKTVADVFETQYIWSDKQAYYAQIGHSLLMPALVLTLILLFAMCLCTGHRAGYKEIVLHSVDKVWLELLALCVLFLVQIYHWMLQMWNGSMARLDFLIAAILFWAMNCLAAEIFLSLLKRMKAGNFLEGSILFLFVREIIFGKLHLGQFPGFAKRLFYELPIGQRYLTLFLLEGLAQGVLIVYVFQFVQKYRGVKTVLMERKGILCLVAYLVLLLLLLATQIHNLRTERADHILLREVEQMSEGDFSMHIVAPSGASYRQTKLVQYLNRVGMRVDEAVEKSVRSERMKTELIANVSHDIKTPLTSIINYVDLLGRQNLTNETAKEYIAILDRKSKRLKTLIEDLIEASKASSGAIELEMDVIDFGEIVTQTNGEFEDLFQENKLELECDIPNHELLFLGDGRRVYRILENLYMNTKKYAMPGTRVYVALQEQEEGIVFSMKNVSAAKLNITPEELTERFVRGDSSRSTEGSGLGLSIAKSLTELMQGTFQIFLDGDLFHVEVMFPHYQEQQEKMEKEV